MKLVNNAKMPKCQTGTEALAEDEDDDDDDELRKQLLSTWMHAYFLASRCTWWSDCGTEDMHGLALPLHLVLQSTNYLTKRRGEESEGLSACCVGVISRLRRGDNRKVRWECGIGRLLCTKLIWLR